MANGILDLCATATPDNILSGQSCDYGGLYKVYYARYSDIDWSAVTWDATTKQISAFAMVATKKFYEIGSDVEAANYSFTLTDQAYYTNDVILSILGKSVGNWGTLTNLRALCGDLVFQVYGRDCGGGRTIGVTRNSADDGFEKVFDPLKLVEHTDSSGTVSEKAKDDVTFRCKSEHSPLFSTVTKAAIAALL